MTNVRYVTPNTVNGYFTSIDASNLHLFLVPILLFLYIQCSKIRSGYFYLISAERYTEIDYESWPKFGNLWATVGNFLVWKKDKSERFRRKVLILRIFCTFTLHTVCKTRRMKIHKVIRKVSCLPLFHRWFLLWT